MEAIKTLLGDELFAQVEGKLAGKKLIFDDGTLIPKHRLDEVIGQRDTFKVLSEQSEKDLKSLKTAARGNEELTAKIESLQEANKAAKSEADANALKLQKSFAVKEALMNAGVKDSEARDLLTIKLGEVELNADGTVKRFTELLKPIRDNATLAALFGETKHAGQQHSDGDNPAPLSQLEQNLTEAQKSGNTARIVSAKRELFEAQQKTKVA
jgi:hypothetical protein